MKVLYASKALLVAAYREKLRALAGHVEVNALMPERWGPSLPEPRGVCTPAVHTWQAWLHGSNHLHVYRRPGAMLDRYAPDLVHIDEEPFSLVTAQLARGCRERGIPCVFFAWQNLSKRLPPPFGRLRTGVFRTVAGGIAGSERAAAVLRSAGFNGPLAVIPQFGVDADRFAPDPAARGRARDQLGIDDSTFVAGFGGRLVPEKGADLLIQAARRVPGTRLLIVGDGPDRGRLQRAARRAGVAARFTGAVPSLEMSGWLAAMDALALPSLRRRGWMEQFGRILIEAMACGVPVIGSDSGEIPIVIGDAGVVVPEGDAAALGDALAGLAADPGRRAHLGARGRRRVLERYTHARIAADTARFYQSLVRSPDS